MKKKDAYKDARFNKETDAKTGYKTQSILTLPINDAQGETVAVLQAINKKSSAGKITIFMQEDEIMVRCRYTQNDSNSDG